MSASCTFPSDLPTGPYAHDDGPSQRLLNHGPRDADSFEQDRAEARHERRVCLAERALMEHIGARAHVDSLSARSGVVRKVLDSIDMSSDGFLTRTQFEAAMQRCGLQGLDRSVMDALFAKHAEPRTM
jgi:hypothetical protein